MFTARAAVVLKAGQVPKNSTMPVTETNAEATASCLHTSPGISMPQNDRAAAANPNKDITQKVLASVVAVVEGREENIHDRAASHPPVASPGRTFIQISAPRAPP